VLKALPEPLAVRMGGEGREGREETGEDKGQKGG